MAPSLTLACRVSLPCITSGRDYTRNVKVGKLTTVGDSMGVIVPRQYREQLGWFKGDQIAQQVLGDTIVLHNVTQRLTRPIVTRREYGDAKAEAGRGHR